MSSTIRQLSCFSSINRYLHLQKRPVYSVAIRSKLPVVMSLEGHGTETSSSEIKATSSYAADTSKLPIEGTAKSYQSIKNDAEQMGMTEPVQEYGVTQQKRTAKIHDFCFGIPYGGLVLSGSFVGFIFSKNPTALSTGVLFGGALLALSTLSLKIWRQGKSSLPFVLGQAVLSAALLWKNFQTYSLTKKLFPTGFFAIISAAMLCFYSYVMISGGNPPPKKLKATERHTS